MIYILYIITDAITNHSELTVVPNDAAGDGGKSIDFILVYIEFML